MKNSAFFLAFILLVTVVSGCSEEEPRSQTIRVLGLGYNEKQLLFYGSTHSNDANDPMFEDIESKFLEFQPDAVLVEGGFHRNGYSDRNHAIDHGESAFVVYLAGIDRRPVGGMEPAHEDAVEFLLESYNPESILAMFVFRQVIQLQREAQNRSVDFEAEIRQVVEDGRQAGLEVIDPEGDFSTELMNIIGPYLDENQDFSNWTSWDAQELVYQDQNSELHEIWQATIVYRDDFGVAQIERVLDDYDRVFVIMGHTHLTNQEDRLRALFSTGF